MKTQKTFAVIGGDARQVHTINSLAADGFAVNYYGIESEKITSMARCVDSIDKIMEESDIILCPVPFTKDKVYISSSGDKVQKCEIIKLSNLLTQKHLLISANIPKNVIEMCDYKSAEYIDLMKRDDFCLLNAVATAEGAIAEAVKMSDINLHQSRVLVLGFGRCARILAKKLAAIDAHVSVSVRNRRAESAAVADGYEAFSISKLDKRLNEFDFIFNTIPAIVLDEDRLKRVDPESVIIDIASAPGGVDFEYAKSAGIRSGLFLGIPGKYSPKSSGIIIADIVRTILIEKGA